MIYARHRNVIAYIAVVVTVILVLQVLLVVTER
jgi:hypothetical protein